MTNNSIFIHNILILTPFHIHIVVLILNVVNKISLVIAEEHNIARWVGFDHVSIPGSWALARVVVCAREDVQRFELGHEFLTPKVQVFVLRVDVALQFEICNPPQTLQTSIAKLLFEFQPCLGSVFAFELPIYAHLL